MKDFKNPGDTYFRTCSTIIGSGSLTAVFGMGTGVTFQIWSPEKNTGGGKAHLCPIHWLIVQMAETQELRVWGDVSGTSDTLPCDPSTQLLVSRALNISGQAFVR
jgi:hypothetical protein